MPDVRPQPVYLVGAGPMDKDLLTLRGRNLIRMSDVIVHDRLLDPHLLSELFPEGEEGPELIDVGKRPGAHVWSQERIQQVLIDKARQGKRVVRLKGGDPYVFGRGGEEALALAKAGVPFEVVPGVTSAVAVPALAGIPLTHRGLSSLFVVVTGHEDPNKEVSSVDWEALARLQGTLVVLMGRKRIGTIVEALLAAGLDRETPAAMLSHGPPSGVSRRIIAPVCELPDRAEKEGITAPVVTVIGKVVSLADTLYTGESLPLKGRRLVAVNTSEGSAGLLRPLERLGAETAGCPTIRIHPLRPPELRSLLEGVPFFDWVVFRSKQTVGLLFSYLWDLELDLRSLGSARLAAIGPGTAQALADRALRTDLIPEIYTSQHLLRALLKRDVQGKRFLVPGGDQADPLLPDGLIEAGARVRQITLYSSQCPERLPALPWPLELVDAFLLTSASGTRNFMRLLKESSAGAPGRIPSICIGPVTAGEAERLGIEVLAVANEYTYQGVVKTVLDRLASSPQRR